MKWAAVKSCPVYGGNVKSYNFDAVRQMPGVRSAIQFPIPDPALTRGRIFSGGVAVVADHWHQAKAALERMPIEWDIPPERAAFNTANMRDALLASFDRPGRVRVNQGNVDDAFAKAAKVIEATYSTPYLPRARMEPGNATVLVSNDRVDVWVGDQSPQETRFSASKLTGIPEQNVYVNLCHLGGGFGRNGNGPQAEQAIMIANAHRGTPIHLLWTARGRFRRHNRIARWAWARLKAGLDAEGWPDRARSPHGECRKTDSAPNRPFDVASRYHVPNYRFSNHTTKFHVPVGTRRGIGQAAHEFYRESFMNELAHAAGKDPYRFRRELIARTEPGRTKDDMIQALDMAAEMSGWGKPLPTARRARSLSRKEARKPIAWRPSARWCTRFQSAARARSGWSASTSRMRQASVSSIRYR
jgi:isoquinoline 1-oxidoreductase beta subunit